MADRVLQVVLDNVCLQAGEYAGAMRFWAQNKPFEDLRACHDNANNVSVVKEALAQFGLCTRMIRPPMYELADYERVEVAALLASCDRVQL